MNKAAVGDDKSRKSPNTSARKTAVRDKKSIKSSASHVSDKLPASDDNSARPSNSHDDSDKISAESDGSSKKVSTSRASAMIWSIKSVASNGSAKPIKSAMKPVRDEAIQNSGG